MSRLPPPRNIRSNWQAEPISVEKAIVHVKGRCPVPERFGQPVEARSWIMVRGWRKGELKRIDVAYDGADDAFASVRFSGGFYTLKFGATAAR